MRAKSNGLAHGRGVRSLQLPSVGPGLLLAGALIAPEARAQQVTPTPELLPYTQAQCPAEARIRYDVTSIPGADGIRWELRRGAPGEPSGWDNSQPVASGEASGPQAEFSQDLRSFGPVLNGTPYLVRIRATESRPPSNRAPRNAARWSEAAVYAPSHSPTGMYAATPVTQNGDAPTHLRLQWSLVGELAACADRIRYEVKKDAPFASATAPDPTAGGSSFTGSAGDQVIPLTGGPGEYYVRLVARHGRDAADRDVGTWGAAIRIAVQPPAQPPAAAAPTTHAVTVTILDGLAGQCAGGRNVPASGATVRLEGDGTSAQAVTDPQGLAVLSAPAGTYTLRAERHGCAAARTSLTVAGDERLTLTLTGCSSPDADLAIALEPLTRAVANEPYTLEVTLANQGKGPYGPLELSVDRTGGGVPGGTIHSRDYAYVCPGFRKLQVTDRTPPAGTLTYTAGVDASDANRANNEATLTANFTTAVASTDATPQTPTAPDGSADATPQTPATPDVPVTISSFQLRGGAERVLAGTRLSLDATVVGNPTHYRYQHDFPTAPGSCGEWDSRWLDLPATGQSPYVYARSGLNRVCLQFRRGADGSAILSNTVEDRIEGVDGTEWHSGFIGTEYSVLNPLLTQDLTCRSGQRAVGVRTRAGIYVDGIALYCSPLGPNGEHSGPYHRTIMAGGAGGEAQDHICPSGSVLAGFGGRYGEWIDYLEVYCRLWTQGDGGTSEPVLLSAGVGTSTGGTASYGPVYCPIHMAMYNVTVAVRAAYVGAFRFDCVAAPGLIP